MVDFAELTCILKVNSRCPACKGHMNEVLASIIGVYSLTYDASRERVKISGEVEPDRAINALSKIGKHAEVLWSNISHPQSNRTRHNTYNHHPGYNYNRGGYNMGYGGSYHGALENSYHSNHNYTYGNNMQIPGRGYRPFYPNGRDDLYSPY